MAAGFSKQPARRVPTTDLRIIRRWHSISQSFVISASVNVVDGNVEKEFHIDVQLAWSRDGIHWERYPGRPIFMKTGLYGTYDWGRVYINHGVLEVRKQIYLFYRGEEGLHIKMPRNESTFCLATLRQDGF